MSLDLAIRQVAPQETLRQSPRGAGPDRTAGSAPPPPSPELGPPNPRLRMDHDLGIVVIEFRDAAGQVSVSVPTERELEAYRSAVVYGTELPSYIAVNGHGAKTLLHSGLAMPSIDLAPEPGFRRFLPVEPGPSSLDRVA
jgi:hypothetical protein